MSVRTICLIGLMLWNLLGGNMARAKVLASTGNTEEEVLRLQARPLLRVLLSQHLSRLEFQVQGAFSIQDLNGKVLLRSRKTDQRWLGRVLDGRAASLVHSVLVASFAEKKNAEKLVDSLIAEGYDARVRAIGRTMQFEGGHQQLGLRYRVLVGRLDTQEAAAELLKHFQNEWRPRLVKERLHHASGRVEFTDQDFANMGESELAFRIVPRTAQGTITLFHLPVDTYPDAPTADRVFQGVIEFRVDNTGRLAVVNEVHIDDYLKGVLPAEMDAAFPLEAHKAQAVIARSTVLANLGRKHMTEDWDICAASHCQQYAGCTDKPGRCEEAVEATTGEVLIWKGQICDAVFHTCCGGHGEDKDKIWNTPAEDVLTGRYDVTKKDRCKFKADLEDEKELKSWLLDSPDACWCRVTESDVPAILERSRKYFRWKEVFSRSELEAIIREKTGVDLGMLYEIVPVKRGVSGRIIELELIGSRRNLRLQKELKVREALSPTRLLSSCFTVISDVDANGLAQRFTLLGGGSGHGCGLCQVGAGAQAEAGQAYTEILNHYYPNTELQRIYTLNQED